MQKSWLQARGWSLVALLLALPAAFFILVSLLKYGLGIDGPFDTVTPWLERNGIRDPIGWNINLLILLGPVLAFLLALVQVLQVHTEWKKEMFRLTIQLEKRRLPLFVLAISGLVLGILFFYLLGENCNRH